MSVEDDAQFEDLYKYRCTTDKLLMHLKRIENAGDTVLWPSFVGGRDWLIICRKANLDLDAHEAAALRTAFPSPNLGDARRRS